MSLNTNTVEEETNQWEILNMLFIMIFEKLTSNIEHVIFIMIFEKLTSNIEHAIHNDC